MGANMDRRWVLLPLLFIPLAAGAIVYGGSNLGYGGYPDPDCNRPIAPSRPYDLSDQWAVNRYNEDVRNFNTELQIYSQCVDEYLENAENDIKRIQEAAQDAIDESNRPY